eukprot:79126-Chlamydomonas_euryale.AAC.1
MTIRVDPCPHSHARPLRCCCTHLFACAARLCFNAAPKSCDVSETLGVCMHRVEHQPGATNLAQAACPASGKGARHSR